MCVVHIVGLTLLLSMPVMGAHFRSTPGPRATTCSGFLEHQYAATNRVLSMNRKIASLFCAYSLLLLLHASTLVCSKRLDSADQPAVYAQAFNVVVGRDSVDEAVRRNVCPSDIVTESICRLAITRSAALIPSGNLGVDRATAPNRSLLWPFWRVLVFVCAA